MKILFHAPNYVPFHNSGGERFFHALAKGLQSVGNTIIVIEDYSKTRVFEGIPVRGGIPFDHPKMHRYYKWADIVFTQLGKAGYSMNKCRYYTKPLFHIGHNSNRNRQIELWQNQYFIYNSDFVAGVLNMDVPSIVFEPPCEKYEGGGDHITLINCNENKGGQLLIDLAKAMPDRKFLGILGSYSKQITAPVSNLTYEENTSDIGSVYLKTRILIMPSLYESFGMTAREACGAGVPVICHATGGLMGNLGDVGIYCNRNKIDEWIKEIKKLDDPKAYESKSKEVENYYLKVNNTNFSKLNNWIHESISVKNTRIKRSAIA